MTWPPHWESLENSTRMALEAELQRELKVGHPLFRVPVRAICRRDNQDDVLFEVLDGSGRVAEIHMTFDGEWAIPPCPWTCFCENFDAWAVSVGEDGGPLKETD